MTKTMEEKVALVAGLAMDIRLTHVEALTKAGYITVLANVRKPREQVEKLIVERYKVIAYRCSISNV